MKASAMRLCLLLSLCSTLFCIPVYSHGEDSPEPVNIHVGTGPGWRALGEDDFALVNTDDDTFTFQDDGLIKCKGTPVGVHRTKQQFKNFELVVEWRHLESGGNSGIFAWVDPKALEGLEPNKLPRSGIEVQMLDHGYKEKYIANGGKLADWFTTNGDIFAVGESTMKPFPPLSPNGSRSFPRGEYSKGVGEWNHYYVRAINGELRLWVNGHEVSGGNECQPSEGCLCLESEGAPLEFRNLRVREVE
jgi:hypothetical protein